jgi:DNA modification methylase
MNTFILLSNKKSSIPKEFQGDDNRFPELLVKHLLEAYTKRRDNVIDIFAGLGTTLIVSEKLGRIPFGIESDKKRFDFIKKKIKHKENIILGNSLNLDKYSFPKLDLCIASPPYMPKECKENPLRCSKGSYAGYLRDLAAIYKKLKKKMKKNAYVIIEASNLKGKETTTLAWDIAREISKIFHLEGELVIGWKDKGTCKGSGTYGYGYDHSYCLVFKNK